MHEPPRSARSSDPSPRVRRGRLHPPRRIHARDPAGPDFQGLGFEERQIAELAQLTGENGRSYGFTYSDITIRLASTVLLEAFDDKPVTYNDVVAALERVLPTPPFIAGAS